MANITRQTFIMGVVSFIVAAVVASSTQGRHIQRSGGLSEEKQPDDALIQVVNEVKPRVEEELGKQLDVYTIVSYKSQTVAGTNYFVKVQTGEDEYIHLRIYRSLSGDIQLTSVDQDKSAEDEICYF